MSHSKRIFWACLIFIIDLLVPIIPLTAIFVAYCLITRPAYVKAWIDKIYKETT
jgi:hypothetical protein